MDSSLSFVIFETSSITSINLAQGTDISQCLTDRRTQFLKMLHLYCSLFHLRIGDFGFFCGWLEVISLTRTFYQVHHDAEMSLCAFLIQQLSLPQGVVLKMYLKMPENEAGFCRSLLL